jgi:hypothetical protein
VRKEKKKKGKKKTKSAFQKQPPQKMNSQVLCFASSFAASFTNNRKGFIMMQMMLNVTNASYVCTDQERGELYEPL